MKVALFFFAAVQSVQSFAAFLGMPASVSFRNSAGYIHGLHSRRCSHRTQTIRANLNEPDQHNQYLSRRNILSQLAVFSSAALAVNTRRADAFGAGQREIGEITASGFIFKDTIKVTAFQDPKVEGVELYVSDFQRPINERLQKDFFSDPSQASIGCAKTGVVRISKDIYKGKDGEEVFEQARSLLFKTLRVRRQGRLKGLFRVVSRRNHGA